MANIPKIGGIKKIQKMEVVPFTRQVASMIGAGMPILSTIQTLEEQCANKEFQKVLTYIRETIEGGDPMSRALAAFPRIFDEMYVNMVVAGEQSGEFAGIMKRLAIIIQSTARLKQKVKSAMTYPTVIVSIALLLAAGLIQFVVPVFGKMFSGFGKDLPALTQGLLDLSAFVSGNWYYILGSLIVGITVFRKWKSTASGRYKFDRFKLKMPVFGQLNLKSRIGRFCRILAQMTKAGVPILKALEVSSGSVENRVLEKSILDARKEVEQGNQLNVALDGKPFMPVIMVRMIAAGEKAGKVEDMLDSVADSYDEEVETLLATLTALMEPFLMVFLGGIIGTIVLAMFMPIFSLGDLARH